MTYYQRKIEISLAKRLALTKKIENQALRSSCI